MEHDVYHYCGFNVQNSFSEPMCLQGSGALKFPLPNFWNGVEEDVSGARSKICPASLFCFLGLTAIGSIGKETLAYFSRRSIPSLIFAVIEPNLN
jgi:hypothetical protein